MAEVTTCLIVDDEARLRQVLATLMRGDGYHCLEAANGAEALDVIDAHPVALVVSDLRMPVMDGIELLRIVRQRHPDVAVVMITAVAEIEIAVQCLADGAMDYLLKPYQFEEVRARVTKALEKRRLIIENRDYQERLETRVRMQQHRLEELFQAGILALSDALEAKDPYTRGHSVRVSSYAAATARELGLTGEVLRQVELGGHVHDLGKIGVRETVLNKAGPLTPDEYNHIMTHPMIGWRILAPLLGDAPVALRIVRSHHERFDGRGLPDGLAGNQIPIEARICAAVDALDAMTSDRPYRRVDYPLDVAIEELRRCAGSQFDPEVVEAIARCAQRGELRAPQRLIPAMAREPLE